MWDLLNEGSSQAVHDPALPVLSGPVAEDLVALQNSPMLLKAVSLSLQVTNPFQEVGVFDIVGLTEAFYDLVF